MGMRYEINSWRRSNSNRCNRASVSEAGKHLFIVGFTPTLNSDHKKKAREWLALKGLTAESIYFTHALSLGTPWVDPSRIVEWEVLKAELPKAPKKPRVQSTAPGRLAGTFDLVSKDGRTNEQDVPSAKPLYYIGIRDYNANDNLKYILNLFDYDTSVVLLPANRRDKFLRHYPHAIEILSELRGKIEYNGVSLIPADGMEYLKMNWTERSKIAKMDESRVDDPELKRLIKICKNGDSYLEEYKKHLQLAGLLGRQHNFKRHDWERSYDCKVMPLTEKYPLASNFGRDPKTDNHAYYYINAVYTARKAGKSV
jgi:hypothetical protein